MEHIAIDALQGKNKDKAIFKSCTIHIHSIRTRLCDEDGISAKYLIDLFAKAGIYEDDNHSIVKKVSFSQEKCKDVEQETVIITISRED